LPKTQDEVLDKLDGRKVDLVLSDIAPARSSNKELDHDKIIELSSSVVRFSTVNECKSIYDKILELIYLLAKNRLFKRVSKIY
jgi:23S rRNA U2552 (ribose-2'-O)-methylase RlmE/FtsJ